MLIRKRKEEYIDEDKMNISRVTRKRNKRLKYYRSIIRNGD